MAKFAPEKREPRDVTKPNMTPRTEPRTLEPIKPMAPTLNKIDKEINKLKKT